MPTKNTLHRSWVLWLVAIYFIIYGLWGYISIMYWMFRPAVDWSNKLINGHSTNIEVVGIARVIIELMWSAIPLICGLGILKAKRWALTSLLWYLPVSAFYAGLHYALRSTHGKPSLTTLTVSLIVSFGLNSLPFFYLLRLRKGFVNKTREAISNNLHETNSNLSLFLPRWVRMIIPAYLRPSIKQIARLEVLRKRIDVSHEEFVSSILGHPKTTEKSLRHTYLIAKAKQPHYTEHELFELVLLDRQLRRAMLAAPPFGIDPTSSGENDYTQALQIVSQFKSFEELVAWVLQREYTVDTVIDPAPEYKWAAEKMTKILCE